MKCSCVAALAIVALLVGCSANSSTVQAVTDAQVLAAIPHWDAKIISQMTDDQIWEFIIFGGGIIASCFWAVTRATGHIILCCRGVNPWLKDEDEDDE
jgi:ABC-type Fe3+-siderophore transport system permease subunit